MQVFVTGMHRSGTSVLSRVLNLMGLNIGDHASLMKKRPENPSGFWERDDVMQLNDRILSLQGCSWNRVLAARTSLIEEFTDESVRKGIAAIIAELEVVRPWMLKDPRLCFTLGAWASQAEVPYIVVSLRDPMAIATSLRARSAMPLEAGIALTELYLCSLSSVAKKFVERGAGCSAVRWEDLRDAPRDTVTKLAAELERHYGCGVPRLPGDKELSGLLRRGIGNGSEQSSKDVDAEMERCIARLSAIVDVPGLLTLGGASEWSLRTLARYQSEQAAEEGVRLMGQRLGRMETLLNKWASDRELVGPRPAAATSTSPSQLDEIRKSLEKLESSLAKKSEETKARIADDSATPARAQPTSPQQDPAEIERRNAEALALRKQRERVDSAARVIQAFESSLQTCRTEIQSALPARPDDSELPLTEPHDDISAKRDDLTRQLASIQLALLGIEHSLSWRLTRMLGRLLGRKSQSDAVAFGTSALNLASATVTGLVPDVRPPALATERIDPGAPGISRALHKLNAVLDVLLPALSSTRQLEVTPDPSVERNAGHISSPRVLVQMTVRDPRNGYYSTLSAALARAGRDVRHSIDLMEMVRYSLDPKANITLWFHQLEPFYRGAPESTEQEVRKNVVHLISTLRFLKKRGVKLVHTWHNRVPHDRRNLKCDILLYSQLADLFDLIFVHSDGGVDWIRKWSGATRIKVIPHHALPASLPASPPAQVSDRPQDSPFRRLVTFGEFKPYKSLTVLADAWSILVRTGRLPEDASLSLLGKWLDSPELRSRLLELPRVEIRDSHFDNATLAQTLRSSDLSVFTHGEIWVSGAAITSLSCGVPVVIPAGPCMGEYVENSQNGFLFESRNAASLADTLELAFATKFTGHMRTMARAWADDNHLDRIMPDYMREIEALD